MAVVSRRRTLAWAVVDATEIRSTGEMAVARRTRALALRRLVLREKPTALVVGRRLGQDAAVIARQRVPIVAAPRRLMDASDAADLYPELPVFAAVPLVLRATRLAVTTLLTSSFPSRTYAHRCYRTPVRARRGARTLRGHRDTDRPRARAHRLPR